MRIQIRSIEKDSDVYTYTLSSKRDVREELAQKIIQNGWKLIEITLKGMTLEEIYMKLIREG